MDHYQRDPWITDPDQDHPKETQPGWFCFVVDDLLHRGARLTSLKNGLI